MKLKKILQRVAAVIIAIIVAGGAVWLITGRSPMAIIVKSALHQMDTESYDKAMADKTDKRFDKRLITVLDELSI